MSRMPYDPRKNGLLAPQSSQVVWDMPPAVEAHKACKRVKSFELCAAYVVADLDYLVGVDLGLIEFGCNFL